MLEKEFVAGYAVFTLFLWTAVLLILGWRLEKKYLRPVLFGVLFGLISQFLFGLGPMGLFIGGLLVGYMIAVFASTGLQNFRVGGLSGLIMDASFLLAVDLYLAVERPDVNQTLLQLCVTTTALIFRDIVLAGLGGLAGGFLRRMITPRPT